MCYSRVERRTQGATDSQHDLYGIGWYGQAEQSVLIARCQSAHFSKRPIPVIRVAGHPPSTRNSLIVWVGNL